MLIPVNTSPRFITILLCLAVGITTAQIDIYMASLPYMVTFFDSTQEMLQFSLSASVIGTSIVTLFIGQMSDAIGRRNIIVCAQVLYALIALATAFSTTAEILVFWRFMTGMVTAATFVLSFAVIADIYEPKQAAVCYANLTSSLLVALIIAPMIGGYFAEIQRWDYSFLFLAGCAGLSAISMWLFLPETLAEKRPFSLQRIITNYRHLFTHFRFIGLSIIPGLLIGGIMSFFANGSFYYIEQLQMAEWDYSVHQTIIMAFNCGFSFFAGSAIRHYGLEATCRFGIWFVLAGGVLFCLTAYFLPYTPIYMTLSVALIAAGVGFSFAAVTAMAMEFFPESSSTAASILTLIRGCLISGAIGIAGHLYSDQAIEIAYGIGTLCLVAAVVYFAVTRKLPQSSPIKTLGR